MLKRLANKIIDFNFAVFLSLLGKYEGINFELNDYQLVVTVFWMFGLFKFMRSEQDLKDEFMDAVKELAVSLTVIPLWYLLSGNLENSLFEPCTIIIHFILLIFIVYIATRASKTIGNIAYYIHALYPIIILAFVRLNIKVYISVILSAVILEFISYLCFLKKVKR